MKRRANSKMLNAYSGHAIHSSMRMDARLIAHAPNSEMKNHVNCCFQSRVTKLGISVCPAE
jgi:hypothetical protein